MKCQDCGERDAVVHLTTIHNGEKQEFNLCETCAEKYNTFSINQSFDFHKFFSGLLDIDHPFHSKVKPKQELTCPVCKMNYSTLRKVGKVGCNQCYEVFGEYINPLIRRIHGSEEHKGKIPHNTAKSIRMKKEIERLKEKLQEAIEREEYELAAQIRDQLKIKRQELE